MGFTSFVILGALFEEIRPSGGPLFKQPHKALPVSLVHKLSNGQLLFRGLDIRFARKMLFDDLDLMELTHLNVVL